MTTYMQHVTIISVLEGPVENPQLVAFSVPSGIKECPQYNKIAFF